MKVCDFSRVGKIVVNRWMTHLMSAAFFTIIFSVKGTLKILDVHIPEGYVFKRDEDFEDFTFPVKVGSPENKKAEDYNILSSFLVEYRDKLKNKWGLSALEYVQLLVGLKLCTLKGCSHFSFLKKISVGFGSLKNLRYLFKRSNKK